MPARLSRARHDLRNPLGDILGFSEILQDETTDGESPELASGLQAIRHSAGHLLRQVNQTLDFETFQPSDRAATDTLQRSIFSEAQRILEQVDRLIAQSAAQKQPLFLEDVGRINYAARRLQEIAPLLLEQLHEAGTVPKPLETGDASRDGLERPCAEVEFATTLRHREADSQSANATQATLLIVEDNENNRELLRRRLSREGFTVATAENGRRALECLDEQQFDLVLLDIMMPELDGHAVLERMKQHEQFRHIPVIMISALDDIASLVRCIERGADDYLTKPFDPVLLRARIGACLEKKRLRDQEQVYLQQLQHYLKRLEAEQDKSERLLLNVLPKPIADRLKEGETGIADSFPEVTVLFADLVGFTSLSVHISPTEVVHLLNEVFSAFDMLAAKHGLEKIKTIGDAYMAVAGLPTPRVDHAHAAAELALEMQRELDQFNQGYRTSLRMRIGLDSGPVIAGIIGRNKFIYDLWGDTVNTSSRMESHGVPGCIQMTENTCRLLGNQYDITPRGPVEIKGKGAMKTYFLTARLTQRNGSAGAFDSEA